MGVRDTIDSRISQIDLALARLTKVYDNEVATLRRKREALLESRKLITPEIEAAVRALENVGLSPVNTNLDKA